MDIESRRGLSFAQAEGQEPLPAQLRLREISPQLKSSLWALVHTQMDSSLNRGLGYVDYDHPWKGILRRWWTFHQHKAHDEYPERYHKMVERVKATVFSDNYVQVFDFLQ